MHISIQSNYITERKNGEWEGIVPDILANIKAKCRTDIKLKNKLDPKVLEDIITEDSHRNVSSLNLSKQFCIKP